MKKMEKYFEKKKFIDAVSNSNNMKELLNALGLKYYSRNFKLVKKYAKIFNVSPPIGKNIKYKRCSKCFNVKNIESFYTQKKICKKCLSSITKLYKEKNKKTIKEYGKKYYDVNRIRMRKRKRKYMKERRKNDSLFALRSSISRLIRTSIKRTGHRKKSKTQNILGCTFIEFKKYLESKFEKWMNWQNRGLYNGKLNYGWDLDHIICISTAKTEEEIIKLNHYTNFQPLCSKLNRDVKRNYLF